MKKFNLFGLKFMFEIKKSDRNDAEIYSSSYSLREKVLYLVLVMFVIAFSSKISLLSRNNNYKVGDVVISDILIQVVAEIKQMENCKGLLSPL